MKDASGTFPSLRYVAVGAIFIANIVTVSSLDPSANRLSPADYPYKWFRESKKAWEQFSRYVTQMIGETEMQWEVLSHINSEDSLE